MRFVSSAYCMKVLYEHSSTQVKVATQSSSSFAAYRNQGQVRSRIGQDQGSLYLSNIADGQQIVRLVNLEYRSTQHQHLLLWLGLIAMENGSDNGKGYGKGKGKGPLRGTFRRFRRSQSPPASTSFLASKMVSLVLFMSYNIITIRADRKTVPDRK